MVLPVTGDPVAFGPSPGRSATATSTPQLSPVGRVEPEDRVDVSAAGRQQATAATGDRAVEQTGAPERSTGLPGTSPERDATARRIIESLRQRDQEVRLHEQAHLLAAGPYARGGPSYTYQIGPDGRSYAVGGEVPIDLSPVAGDPQATLQKAQTIRRAALAPAHPSSADLSIASAATAMAEQAQQQLQAEPAERLDTQGASRAERAERVGAEGAPPSETPSAPAVPVAALATPAVRHLCGPNCHSHAARLTPAVNVSATLNPLASATRALQRYQVGAHTFSP